ncbi:hypothetical protein ACRAWG_35130 [Methylobacterium sp. P31]
MSEQAAAEAAEIRPIGDDLKRGHDRSAENRVPRSRVSGLKRDAARLEGERGPLAGAIASAQGQIAGTQLQIPPV